MLASGSPRRRELLARIGIDADVVVSDVDEAVLVGEAPGACALRLSRAKAAAVLARRPGVMVLAADTVVAVGADILGKPVDAADARAMLERLSGETHRVITGFALLAAGGERTQAVITEVTLRRLGDDEITSYVACEEWRGKAGGYAAQGIAAAFIREVRGSFTNVVGLPLAEVVEALAALGGPLPDYLRGTPS